jgi:hypothetical protein
MICHLVQSYADWWHARVSVAKQGNLWILQSQSMTIQMPCDELALVPDEICFVEIQCGGMPCQVPFPGNLPPQNFSETLPADLLTFLAGQLWRAEELLPQHAQQASTGGHQGFLGNRFCFFDKPIVDLWMRGLFEILLGHALDSPQIWREHKGNQEVVAHPRFWMTFDVDCLQKWKTPRVVKHWARLPLDLLRGRFSQWLHSTREAFVARDPTRDPWFTIPQILHASQSIIATIFWLGHSRDHKAYRYDIRKPHYGRLVRQVAEAHHQNGLHSSPLHANSLSSLGAEKLRLETISGHPVLLNRQHYLRLVPGETFRHLSALGIKIDSTMGFNARTGFRCGSCLPLVWWDLENGCALDLIEMPFIAGDWTLHNPLHFNPEQSRHALWNLADQVKQAGGILTLDFHDLYFSKDYPGHAEFHRSVLEGLWIRGWRDWHPREEGWT